MNTAASLTVSEARENLYDLVRAVSRGLKTYEITIRGEDDSVVLINKSELEAWQETLDILSSRGEISAVRQARKERKTISHQNLLKELGLTK